MMDESGDGEMECWNTPTTVGMTSPWQIPRQPSASPPSSLPLTARSLSRADAPEWDRIMSHEPFPGYNDLSCFICKDLIASAAILVGRAHSQCGHSGCGYCLSRWLDQGKTTCPLCRSGLSSHTPIIANLALDSIILRLVKDAAARGVALWSIGEEERDNWEGRRG